MVMKASAVATYGGSALAFFAGMSANEFAALGGLAIAAAGLVINAAVTIWYRYRLLQIANKHGVKLESSE